VKLSKFVPVLAICVALTGTLAAQATKAPAGKSADKATQATSTKKGAAPKMTAADLPAAVRDAVMKAHPSGTIAGVTTSMAGSDTVYNVKVTDAGKTSTMHLKADGTMAGGSGKAKSAETKSKGK
jgi:hypothetical protein